MSVVTFQNCHRFFDLAAMQAISIRPAGIGDIDVGVSLEQAVSISKNPHYYLPHLEYTWIISN
jgi:hypothetical protein